MNNTLTKEQWVEELTGLLCKSQQAKNDEEKANCRNWAEATYDWQMMYEESHEEIMSPQEAHDDEINA